MNRQLRTILVLTAVMALLAVVLSAQAAPPTQESAAQQGGLTVSKTVTERQQAAAMTYWTRERMAAAEPFPMPVDSGPADIDASALQNPAAAGPIGYAPGGAPSPDADRQARTAFPADWAANGKTADAAPAMIPASGMGTSQVYSSYIVNQDASIWKKGGNKLIGRLYSTGGYCSASVVSGNNIIVTAAHCLYDTTNNRWYSSWVFSPAYRNGTSPYGVYSANTCWVLTAWVNLGGGYNINAWAPYDVGVCTMNKNAAGQSLSAMVGYEGRMWNYGYVQSVHNLGYPWNDYRNIALTNAGKYLRLCTSETFQQASNVLGGGCNWGPGISGGPWVVGYNPWGWGYVDSVNSGLFINTQNLYGARFNSNNIVPLCNAAGC